MVRQDCLLARTVYIFFSLVFFKGCLYGRGGGLSALALTLSLSIFSLLLSIPPCRLTVWKEVLHVFMIKRISPRIESLIS